MIVGQRLHKKFLPLLQFNINATNARHDVLVHENYAISHKNAKTEQKQHHWEESVLDDVNTYKNLP